MNVNIGKKIRWIHVASFFDLFAVSLILPSMSARLRSLGASHFVIGGMTSIYAGAQLLSGPIIGSFSDKIGRRNIFIATYLIISCCYPILGLTNSLYVTLFIRATTGIFKHGQMLLQTIVRDEISVEYQPQIIGELKSIAGLSFTLGPVIGGHLAEYDNGFSYICICTGALLAINIVIGYSCLADGINRRIPERNNTLKVNIVETVRSLANINCRTLGKVFVLRFILDTSTGLFHSNYSLKIQKRFNISPKVSGYTIAFQSFIGVITGIYISNINDRFYKTDENYQCRNIHGFIFTSVAYVGIYFASHLYVFILWTVILTSCRMFLRVILSDMLMKKCSPLQIGSTMGSVTSISNLARLITPLTAGFIEDLWGVNSANILAAIIAGVGMCISFRIQQIKHDNTSNNVLNQKYN